MKLYKVFVFLLFILIGYGQTKAQYQMLLENGIQLNPKLFQFDVYVVSTGTDFTLTSYAAILTFDNAIVNGGTLSYSYVTGSSQISFTPAASGVQIRNDAGDANKPNLLIGSNPGSQIVSTTPLRLGTFQLSNTANFGVRPVISLAWDFAGTYKTMVNISGVVSTVPANHINALSPYYMTLQNGVQTSATSYSFDVYIVRQNIDFVLNSYQVCLTYNTAVANGGTLTYSYVPGSTALISCTPAAAQVINDAATGTSNLIFGSMVGSDAVSAVPVKVGTFTLSNTVPFAVAPLNAAWDFTGNWVTNVNINSTDVALPANHLNSLNNAPLPVELSSFTGASAGAEILLSWSTATEVNNYGFEIERAPASLGKWERIGFVKGNGNSNSPKLYSFSDSPLGDVKFQYRLKQVDFSGVFKYYDPIEIKLEVPANFSLLQNYPNPFNPTTTIRFNLPMQSKVTLKVFNILGEEVTTLVNNVMNAGHQEVTFDASKLASGMYIYRIEAGSFIQVKKMLLMK